MSGIPSKIHGAFDYIIGLYLISLPWLFDLTHGALENLLAVAFGAAILLYSLCTDYEWGYLEELEFRTHLLLDFLAGIMLTVSPWLFGFYDRIYLPFVAAGTIQIISTFVSKTENKRPQNPSQTSRPRAVSQAS
jgi:hypothetical protein